MKVLKLHGHFLNTGGIVNLQNSLKKHYGSSEINYYHFRTGKIQSNKILSNNVIRLFDQIFSYLYYIIYIIITKPDVIEINSSLVKSAFMRDFIYAKLTRLFKPKIKLILFNHGWNYDFKNYQLKKNKSILTSHFNTFDSVIVLADIFKQELLQLNVNNPRIHIITTGINLSDYEKFKINAVSKKSYYVLFLSRVEKNKGVEQLVKSIPQVLKIYPKTIFNIAGTGSFLEEIKKHTIVKQHSQNIVLNGYVKGDDKLKLLKRSDIFAFPSFYGEGCPVSVLEALAVGLPIIYTEVGALPDLLVNNVNGILIDKKNEFQLANAIIELLENHELRKKLHKNNIELSSNFDLSIINNKLEFIYKS